MLAACALHGRIAVSACGLQALQVLAKQAVLVFAQVVEVVPRKQATVMAIRKSGLDRVIANGLDLHQVHIALAGLQHLLTWAVPLHFGRRASRRASTQKECEKFAPSANDTSSTLDLLCKVMPVGVGVRLLEGQP
jgi:hypothetical protein